MIIDAVIAEPPGGAHLDHPAAAAAFREVILRHLTELSAIPAERLLAERYAKYRDIGEWQGKR